MAIDTNNEKLALINLNIFGNPPLPLPGGTLMQGDQQQLLWGYPGIDWAAPPTVSIADCKVLDRVSTDLTVVIQPSG